MYAHNYDFVMCYYYRLKFGNTEQVDIDWLVMGEVHLNSTLATGMADVAREVSDKSKTSKTCSNPVIPGDPLTSWTHCDS